MNQTQRTDPPIAITDAAQSNVDRAVTDGFGAEWSTFRQTESEFSAEERQDIFKTYFGIFPWERLPKDGGVGADIGCGSGRWSMQVAPRVRHLHLMDASEKALTVARSNLSNQQNVTFHHASVGEIPFAAGSLDFAFSLGVLHHVPDTRAAIQEIANKLKPGAPFLVYLYYRFDNRPMWFRALWRATDVIRRLVSRLPHPLKMLASQLIAATVYWPLARLSALLERCGASVQTIPLSFYRHKSFYVMRTDAYDRFCTALEQRFTRDEITSMLAAAGFESIRFSDSEPYWCAVGIKAR